MYMHLNKLNVSAFLPTHSSQTSPMASSRSNNKWNHDVFLSFRGPDTRNTFTGHLYRALRDKGVNVFIDDELQRGEVVTSQLPRAIEESRISIILLSENYASSPICLVELTKILECKVSKEHTVFPVFYYVEPTDVRNQTGNFGEEFAKLEAKQFNFSNLNFRDRPLKKRRIDDHEVTTIKERVQDWRLALTEVGRLSGWHLKKGDHESKIIQDIVKKVRKKLDYTPLHVADHPIELNSRVKYILQKLKRKSDELKMKSDDDVCVIGLHGMGGVGKSTTAAALYNECASQFEFEGSCFLSNVRENSNKHGIAKLQQTLLSKILGDQEQLVDTREGIELIKMRLGSKKVLIVIDDVDDLEQLRQLAGGLEWFGGGSIIIITTRNSRLLVNHGVTMIHEVKEMVFDEALQLFSWYAFKKPQPDEAFMELSRSVIKYLKGLPLALKVLGSSLNKRSAKEWDDMLEKLKQRPCSDEMSDVLEVLKISYDGLKLDEKTIFLDIAFFFKGRREDEITEFLDGCGFRPHIGIQRLIECSLVYVDYGERLEMHDLLEAMGTKIAHEEHSRLCIRERRNILRLLVKDKRAYDVEILVLDLYGEEEAVSLKWLEDLTNLRVLVIRNGCFIEMPRKLPNNIRWLEWRNCPLKSIPFGFLPSNLVELEMSGSTITKVFLPHNSKAPPFMNLTRIEFVRCEHLRELDIDFSSIPNIEHLFLRRCEKLKRIHESIGRLKKLKTLHVGGCSSLTSRPSLKIVNLDFCSKLENLANLPTTLTYLRLDRSGMTEIPSFIGDLHYFFELDVSLQNCPNLLQFPEPECPNVRPRFRKLSLSFNDFVFLPISAFKFLHIRETDLSYCKWLVEIPELPRTLERLQARNCKSLVKFSQFQFGRFEGDFSNWHKISGENEKQIWREMVEKEDYPLKDYQILIPGNEIPEWFSYVFDCEGDRQSFQVPSSILNAKLIGIAWCAVFIPYKYHCLQIEFSMNEFYMVESSATGFDFPRESAHLWFGFRRVDSENDIDLFKPLEGEQTLRKFFCHWISKSRKEEVYFLNLVPKFKKVGVHFIFK